MSKLTIFLSWNFLHLLIFIKVETNCYENSFLFGYLSLGIFSTEKPNLQKEHELMSILKQTFLDLDRLLFLLQILFYSRKNNLKMLLCESLSNCIK